MNSFQPEPVMASQEGQRPTNPGSVLREARLAQGLSEKEIATSLRLSPRTLEFIEHGQFDRLPGDTFSRGYIRAYARLLKLDANKLVLDYDRMMGIESRERPLSGISKISPYSTGTSTRSRIWLRASTVGVLAAVMASALWWWNDNRMVADRMAGTGSEALLEEVHVDALPLPVPLPGIQLAGMSLGEEAEVTLAAYAQGSEEEASAGSAAVSDETAATEMPAPSTEAAQPAATTAETPATPAAAQPVGATAGVSTLSMSFREACWVQVSAADGRVLHSGLMQGGQTVNLDHEGPLQLVIGAVEGLASIQYRGAEVELPANRTSGVVRLRLGQ
jgi:cytoskeleton protein RodZ